LKDTKRRKAKGTVVIEADRAGERQKAHALIDKLSGEQLQAVRNLLEVMVTPLARALASAPVEDEEITVDTAKALDRSRAALRRGQGIPHDEILREFGLKK
jgi:hypothetical protein